MFYGTYHIGTLIGILCALLYLAGFFLSCRLFYRIVILILTVYLLLISIRMILACFRKPEEDDILLVLGAHFTKDHPSTIMQERIHQAEVYLKEHPQAEAVLSGGKTTDEPWAEAIEMEKMLKKRGIDSSRLIKEEKSLTTADNMRFSASLLRGRKAAVVTNEFHMYRALKLAEREGIKADAVPCRTAFRYLGIYWLREIAAMLVRQ